MSRLDGKVVIVTGAAAGIGAVTAQRIAKEGAHTVLADKNIDGVCSLAAKIEESGGSVLAVEVDIAEVDSVRSMVAAAVERFGGVDVLDNNAAATSLAALDVSVADADPAVWDETVRINLRGTMTVIQAALPHLIARGGGSIINISSAAALVGDLRNPAYSASKAAIISLTRSVATEVGKSGVRCNAIAPGLIVVERNLQSLQGPRTEVMLRHQLSPRLGSPDDIAAAVVFLASDESAFITGHTLLVDGGLLAHQPFCADMQALNLSG